MIHFNKKEVKLRLIKTVPYCDKFGTSLTWDKVGVAKFDGYSKKTIKIPLSQLFRKAVLCQGVLSSAPRNLLKVHFHLCSEKIF